MDDEIEINLRPHRQVVHRLLGQIALANRLALEELGEYGPEEEEERFDLIAWLIDANALNELTPYEREFLKQRLGTVQPEEAAEYQMSLEPALALAWALDLTSIAPNPPLPFDASAFLDLVPSPAESAGAVVDQARLRTLEEIALQREIADLWFWRLDMENPRRKEARRGVNETEAQIAEVVDEVRQAGHPIDLIDNDFALGGQPVRRLSLDHVFFAASLALGRLHALNWLCGYGESWDRVPVEV